LETCFSTPSARGEVILIQEIFEGRKGRRRGMNTLSRHSAGKHDETWDTSALQNEENGVRKTCIELEICSLFWFFKSLRYVLDPITSQRSNLVTAQHWAFSGHLPSL
jgi:hypothetical protein